MKKLLVFSLMIFICFSCNRPKQTICGVPIYGTPFDLIEELAFNDNSEAFPFEYLLLKDKIYIYCEDKQGNPVEVICDYDSKTRQIQQVFLGN